MPLWIAIALFAVFSVNLIIGATGGAAFLDDVQEMLVLFATSIAFVVGILKRESAESEKAKNS